MLVGGLLAGTHPTKKEKEKEKETPSPQICCHSSCTTKA
jgi:hypothetical protein